MFKTRALYIWPTWTECVDVGLGPLEILWYLSDTDGEARQALHIHLWALRVRLWALRILHHLAVYIRCIIYFYYDENKTYRILNLTLLLLYWLKI